MRALPLVLCLCLALGGCSRLGSLNPAGWFGGGGATRVAATPARTPPRPLIDPAAVTVLRETRPLLSVVERVRLDRTPTGAVLSATGLAPGPGRFNAELVRRGIENGELIYDFRAEAPPAAATGGSPAQRRITAAEALDAADLAGLRGIRVVATTNSAAAR